MKARLLMLAAALVLTAAPVAKADPAGTVPVNKLPSLMPRITILGASSAGMLYGSSGRRTWVAASGRT